MTRLLLVRHGITEYNSTRRFAGYSDIELSAAGTRQVESLRDQLADERFDAVYSSDLKRALVTAEVVSSGRRIDIMTCSELREMNYGDAEGLTFAEISSLYPDVARLCHDFSLELEFPGGETFKGFIARTAKFLDRLKSCQPEQSVLIVSHGGTLRLLICHLLGIDPCHWWQVRIDNASLSIVEIYSQRAIITRLNDTSHLKTEKTGV